MSSLYFAWMCGPSSEETGGRLLWSPAPLRDALKARQANLIGPPRPQYAAQQTLAHLVLLAFELRGRETAQRPISHISQVIPSTQQRSSATMTQQVSFAVHNAFPPQRMFSTMLNPEGSLTASGMLYEGNWAEWEVRVFALMCQHSEKALKKVYKEFWRIGAGTDDVLTPVAKELGVTIRGMVSPAMLARYPVEIGINDPIDFNQFLFDLRVLAQPFPIMKLPAELRLRIYGHVLADRDPMFTATHVTVEPRRRFMSTKFHPLARVSHTIRQEFLPMYFEKTKIEVDAGPGVVNGRNNWLSAQEIKAFEAMMGPQNIKMLRNLTFSMGRLGYAEFTYTKFPQELKMVAQRSTLPDRAKRCFNLCLKVVENHGEEGEFLVMAMWTAWNYPLTGIV